MPIARRSAIVAACSTALLAFAGTASAQSWPTKPVRLLVGFPGGSTPDVVARIVAEPLSKALGQPIVVENKPGASGNISADLVAKATDDHTIGVVINGNLTSSQMLYPNLPYDPAKDFSYISLLATAPLVLVANNNLPTGKEFLPAAAASGQKWSYGSVGVGSVGHLGMELMESRVPGFKAVHVPYRGNPQILTDMIGGQVQLALIPPGLAMPQVQAGKVKAIGLTTAGRSALVPDLPSLSEIGVKDFNLEVWTALLGPASLSPVAQKRLSTELAVIMKSPDVRKKLFDQGWQAVGTSPEGMKLRVKDEAAIMGKIISTKGIKLN
ncbi:tripartite tricarboxylate transporter substrate binding protein [Variovorax dokdonensis]|uniref:Tripartite tricarboxylate transporter substrate binding protein n=1 Tax=Variovorax dokdonensis TaxID=344883 RepID=A0ABT7N9Z1_9BURK|nr:tripartite tricarboxylate transporter substrate binding protein [Variovorax dokdonensis]MDM0044751.1 tripartite tricarboxylate transporter substrate binding protein [Variovorax dokdonensis]